MIVDSGNRRTWQSNIRLRYANHDGTTRIVEHEGDGRTAPEAPTYPEGQTICHNRLVYPPSGIASGGSLRVRIDVTDVGHAVLSSTALRLNRSEGPVASADRKLTVSNSSVLEWLPLVTNTPDHGQADLDTRVILEEGSRFIGWDLVALAPSRADQPAVPGSINRRLEVLRAGQCLVADAATSGGLLDGIPTGWGADGHRAGATFVAVHPDGIGPLVQDHVHVTLSHARMLHACSVDGGTLIVRVLGPSAAGVSVVLEDLWRAVRPSVLDGPGWRGSPTIGRTTEGQIVDNR